MLIRSVLFYFFLYLWTLLLGIVSLPCLFLQNKYVRYIANLWIEGILWLLKLTCGLIYEIRGKENIPDNAIIIASKHQSTFETFLLFRLIKKSIFIHKKELFLIPIFGLYLKKSNMIAIKRDEGPKALRKMLTEAKQKILDGHSIIIFPEGTRKMPGERPDYKTGIAGIYKETEAAILPVALNSGFYWPKNTFIKKSGKIIVKFLKPIPSGLNKSEILNTVEAVIEEAIKKSLK